VAAADPSNAQRQRERGIAREKIGDVLLAAGQADKAVEAYRASLEIREKLLAEDPSNTMWLRDAAVLREKTGAALSATFATRRGNRSLPQEHRSARDADRDGPEE